MSIIVNYKKCPISYIKMINVYYTERISYIIKYINKLILTLVT